MAIGAPSSAYGHQLLYLSWMTEKNKNNASGIFWYLYNRLVGLHTRPHTQYVSCRNRQEPIMMALGATALVFFGASSYVLTTRKNLSLWAVF